MSNWKQWIVNTRKEMCLAVEKKKKKKLTFQGDLGK